MAGAGPKNDFDVDINIGVKTPNGTGLDRLVKGITKLQNMSRRSERTFKGLGATGKKSFTSISNSTRHATQQLKAHRAEMIRVTNQYRAINRVARVGMATGQGVRSIGRGIGGGLGGYAMGAAKYGAVGAAYGVGRATVGLGKSSIGLNKTFESGQAAVAATLQLFDHSKGSVSQFADNVGVAKQEFEELFKIAAKSPATLEETQTLYKNMLPGAISATHDMKRIQRMVENSLAIGMINYGDYATTGSQLSRIMSGGAGAEQETWRALLSHGILEEGKKRTYFGKDQRKGKDLTAAFNALDEGKRLVLVEATLQRMNAVVDYLSVTFEGLTSRVQGAGEVLRREFGKASFDVIKRRLFDMVRDPQWERDKDGNLTGKVLHEAGVLNPDSHRMQRLKQLSGFGGAGLAALIDKVLLKIEEKIIWLADNWEKVAVKLIHAADQLWTAAKMLVKYQVARAALGGVVGAGGGAISLVSKGLSGASNIATSAAQMGASAGAIASKGIYLAAVAAIGASALAGLAVAIGGVIAYWVENWDAVLDGFLTGAITLQPLLQQFDLLWNKFVAVGQVWMGTSNIIDSSNNIVQGLSNGMATMMWTFEMFLRILGYVDVGLEVIVLAFQGLYMALLSFVAGIGKVVSFIPGIDAEDMGIDAIYAHMDAVGASMAADLKDITSNKFLAMADAWEKASFSLGESFIDGLASSFEKYAWENSDMGKMWNFNQAAINAMIGTKNADNKAREEAKKNRAHGKNVTHIDKVIIHQDLRNKDPDRMASIFWRDFHKKTNKRVAANVSIPGRS